MNWVLMQLIKKRIVQADFYSAPQFVRHAANVMPVNGWTACCAVWTMPLSRICGDPRKMTASIRTLGRRDRFAAIANRPTPQFISAMFKIVRGVEVIQNHLDAYINDEYKLYL
jgi:hypothetical protein